jgi:hypothetical protein
MNKTAIQPLRAVDDVYFVDEENAFVDPLEEIALVHVPTDHKFPYGLVSEHYGMGKMFVTLLSIGLLSISPLKHKYKFLNTILSSANVVLIIFYCGFRSYLMIIDVIGRTLSRTPGKHFDIEIFGQKVWRSIIQFTILGFLMFFQIFSLFQ